MRHLRNIVYIWIVMAVCGGLTWGIGVISEKKDPNEEVYRDQERRLKLRNVEAPPAAATAPAPTRPPCDMTAAGLVRKNIGEMARIVSDGKIENYYWGAAIDDLGPDRKLRLVRAAADSEACLSGAAIVQVHYLNGNVFGRSDPLLGSRLADW